MYSKLNERPSLTARALRVVGAGVVGGVLVTVAGLGVHHVVTDADFHLQQVEIVGNHRANTTQLRHLADVPRDAHIATVDLAAVRRGVERHPWVRDAAVRRGFPASIVVEVTEHEPELLLALDRLWYLDADGHPIKQADAADLDYPVITGMSQALADARPDLAAAIVEGALRVLATCDGSPIDPARVSEIHYDSLSGYALVLTNGTRLLLGTDDPAPAMDRLSRMVAAGLDLSDPQKIDLVVETVAIATPLPPIGP